MNDFLTEKLLLNTQHGLDCTVEVCKPGHPDDDKLVFKGPAGDCFRFLMEYELPMDGGSYFSFTTNQDNYCGYNFEEISWKLGFDPERLSQILGQQKSVDSLLEDAQGKASAYNTAKKLTEHTYGDHIFMRLEVDGEVHEVSNYAGRDGKWDSYKTTADGTDKRDVVIKAFEDLY